MDFSLTTLFVATTGTLQASGSTDVTANGQIGLFRPDYTLATAGNIAAAKYFYIATGRPSGGQRGVGSIRSDKISALNVIDWYKTVAEDTASQQISTIGSFTPKCGEEVVVTFRVQSKFIEVVYFNGLQESVRSVAPCCDCGDSPCDDIDAADIQALVDDLIAKARANPRLSAHLTFERYNSGATSGIRVAAIAPQRIVNTTDIAAREPYFDRTFFRVFAYTGNPTTQDFLIEEACDGVSAAATVTQISTYQHGTSDEVAWLERKLYPYQQPAFKSLYRNPAWNGQYQSNVVDGTFYDLYYLKCREYDQQRTWASYVETDFTVIVAFATTTGSAFETVLTAALGAPKNNSGLDISTTTTTSTSSTTTTTTSTLTP